MTHVPLEGIAPLAPTRRMRRTTVVLPTDPGLIITGPSAPCPASRRRPAPSQLLVPAVDCAAVATAWFLAATAHAATTESPVAVGIAAVAGVVALQRGRSSGRRVGLLRTVETSGLIRTALASGAAAVVLDQIWDSGLGVLSLITGTVGALGLLLLGRELCRPVRRAWHKRGGPVNATLLVGGDAEAAGLHRLLQEHDGLGLDVIGRVGPAVAGHADLDDVAWLGDACDAAAVAVERGVRDVMIATSDLGTEQLNDVVRQLIAAGIDVHLSSGIRGLGSHHLSLSPVALEPLLRLEASRTPMWQRTATRVLDVTVAGLVLVMSLPVALGVTLLIKLQDGGPVLFRQQRVGKDGRHFTLYKFRTMVEDAEQRLIDLRDGNERQGPLFKMAEDPRVTRLGRFLRLSSIDELPQLLNVLRGDMALVGPRPALPAEVLAFSPRLRLVRCAVKPGITGLWQVEARDNPSFWSYERLDLYYVENWSLALELAILLATVPVVISRGLSGLTHLVGGLTRRLAAAAIRG